MTLDIPPGPAYIYQGTVYRVIDGDSWEITIDAGFRVSIRLMCRLRGYSCPELREVGGPESMQAAEQLLTGRKMLIRSYKDRQSFARFVVDAYVWTTEWVSVGEALVSGGFAVRNTL
ncbi:MAG TPA: hypothetical protein VNJ04_16950 [Gemmatimonadaceae bacterium]|nr:hypothetical protein [Gemmatimonadaceae bacterium]